MAYATRNEATLKALVPDEILKAHPWLLDPIPMDFIRFRMAWKQFWPYAWHLYVFLREYNLYGAAVAAQRSTLWYMDGRARVSRRTFAPKTRLELEIKERCTWLIDNAGHVFPTLIEADEDLSPEPEPMPDHNPFAGAPLYEREDIFGKRERGALLALDIRTWEQLDGATVEWFSGLRNCGEKTAKNIIKKWRAWKREQSTGQA